MPGQPARTHARSVSPRQFTLENYRFAASFAAIIVRRASGGPTFSVNSLCGRSWRVATAKPLALVQKLWTLRLPCGRLRKTVKESPDQIWTAISPITWTQHKRSPPVHSLHSAANSSAQPWILSMWSLVAPASGSSKCHAWRDVPYLAFGDLG